MLLFVSWGIMGDLFAQQQDTIYFTPEQKTVGKVLEIGSETVKVHAPPDSVYILNINNVYRLVYADGQSETFFEYRTDEYFVHQRMTKGFGKNLTALNFLAFFRSLELEIHYERFLMDGYLSVKPFFSVHLGKDGYPLNLPEHNRNYSIGLDLHVYPTGQGRVKYFIGPGVEYGKLGFFAHWGMPALMYTSTPEGERMNFYFIYLNNGVLFQPTPCFNIGLFMRAGYREYIGGRRAFSLGVLQTNFGFRF